ncbi:hypothetical protein JOM56_007867 [Amanita muscaria]
MFSKIALTIFLATSLALMANADVTPDEPGPGAVYKTGGTCRTTWNGDKDSTTAWKNMSIELMTGDNFDMIHLTTVASNLDGTTSGVYQYTCPAVTSNAPVYFYQYSAPLATTKQWTTRFTIASASGKTTPAPNATQPGSGDPVPWGIGALSDSSTAVPPPPYLTGSGPSLAPPSTNSTSGISSTATSSSIPMSSSTPADSGSTSGGSSGTAAGGATLGTTANTATAGQATGTTTSNNGATGNTYSIGSLALAVSVLGFTVLF